MANSKILFSIIAFILLFINTSIYAKSIAVLDEEDQDEFLDPIVEKRRLSNIIEEMAGDDKRIKPTNWLMLLYVISIPIVVIVLILLAFVSLKGSGAYTGLPFYCYKSWEQSKKDEEKRRREKEKSISNKMAKKRKEEEIKKLEAQFMDSALFGSGAPFLKLDGAEELPDSFVSEQSTTERVELERFRKAIPVDKRIDDMEEVPSLDGLKRPNRGAMRE
uniref:Transmembrane protein n=1 Tax=Meloidogyne floridensis TaxID=298350 RepID=A0A915P160_9BILA